MIIKKCHIENFGKFSNCDFDFNDGYNVISEENGWGKTTLSLFIKGIFYGLKRTRGNKIVDENEYELYKPLGGGRYGGYIEFEKKDKKYRLERFFGKTEKDEHCALTDFSNGTVHAENSDKKFGDRLFGVNADAFLRTLFLSQKDFNSNDNSIIADKLVAIDEDASEENIKKAVTAIEVKRKELKLFKGKGGLYYDKINRLDVVNNEIEKCENASRGASQIEKDIKVIESDIDDIQKNLKKSEELSKIVREQGAIKERADLYNKKTTELDNLKKELAKKVDIIQNSNATLKDVNEKLNESYTINAYKKDLNTLNDNSCELLEKRREVLSGYKTEPKNADLLDLTHLVKELTEVETNSFDVAESVSDLSLSPVKNTLALILTIISIVLAIGGVATLFFNTIIGVVLIVVGFLGLICGVVLFVMNMLKNNTAQMNKLKNDVATSSINISTNKANIENKIYNLKLKLGLEDMTNSSSIYKLENDINKIIYIDAEIKTLNKQIEDKKEQLLLIENRISNFISLFDLPEYIKNRSISELLTILVDIMRDINALEDRIPILENEINEIKSKGIDISIELQAVDVNELDEKVENLKNQADEKKNLLSTYNNNLRACYLEQERILELEEEKSSLSIEISEIDKKVKLLDKTIEYLTEARETLVEKYLAPVTTKVEKYLEKFSGDNGNFILSSDYKMKVEISGQLLETEYVSLGWKNIYALALRFAFIDEIFSDCDKNDLPFVILDDPFINLDDKHVELSINAIKEIAKERQVIYFVCHSSRK